MDEKSRTGGFDQRFLKRALVYLPSVLVAVPLQPKLNDAQAPLHSNQHCLT